MNLCRIPQEMGESLQDLAPEGVPRVFLLHWQLRAEILPCHGAAGTGCAQGEQDWGVWGQLKLYFFYFSPSATVERVAGGVHGAHGVAAWGMQNLGML